MLLPLLVIVVLLAALGERRNPEKRVDNRSIAESEEVVELQLFNPNEFEYEELRAAGLPTKVAAGIVRCPTKESNWEKNMFYLTYYS